ncbi:uncharacterized protein LOC131242519 isoform X2 [Magnolia sinica]|uniref:uncharacterized protein LOC131242519 isoform X2 n=1 Tax=Magnolia sinica TaxID=86752 RepID=UPI002657E094|nr:uncharacterized protein LOC131242519 isoform X2 [Magnolia sinica]
MVGHVHGIGHSLEMVETVLEVADVAWNAIEHHRHAAKDHRQAAKEHQCTSLDEEIDALQSENQRLRSQLRENINLLKNLTQTPALSKDCPPDLYSRLVATVDSSNFLTQLESLQKASTVMPGHDFPFKEATDLHSVETLVNVDIEEPSWWVWVTHDMVPSNTEERSGIDDESYVIITEELVVDGVANFMARCILANPKSKSLTPEELQKTVTKALGDMSNWSKMRKVWHASQLIYALATWGITLAALYRHPTIVKAAVKGIGASGKVIMKAI